MMGQLEQRDLTQFAWVDTVLASLKSSISGTHKAFKFRRYAPTSLALSRTYSIGVST